MRTITSLVAALSIASMSISPSIALAQGSDANARPKKNNAKISMRLVDRVCNSSTTGTSAIPLIKDARANIDLAERMAKKDIETSHAAKARSIDASEKYFRRLGDGEDRSAVWRGKSLMKRTLTDAEKSAFAAYQSAIAAATSTRNAAIKSAFETEKAATASATAARKSAIDAAIAKRKAAIDAAVTALKANCDATDQEKIAAEKAFRNAVAAARTTYKAEAKAAMKTFLEATKPARDARIATVKAAREAFQTAAKTAKETLVAALKAAREAAAQE